MSWLLRSAAHAYPAEGRAEVVAALHEHYDGAVPIRETGRLLFHGLRLGTLKRTPTTKSIVDAAIISALTIVLTIIVASTLLPELFSRIGFVSGYETGRWPSNLSSLLLAGWLSIVRTATLQTRTVVGILVLNLSVVLQSFEVPFFDRGPYLPKQLILHAVMSGTAIVLSYLVYLARRSSRTLNRRGSTRHQVTQILVLVVGFSAAKMGLEFSRFNFSDRIHLGGLAIFLRLFVASLQPSNIQANRWPRWPFVIGITLGLASIVTQVDETGMQKLAIELMVSVALIGFVCVAIVLFATQPVPMATAGLVLFVQFLWLISLGIGTPAMPVGMVSFLCLVMAGFSTRRIFRLT